ncbi:MAG TPA: hypothetical protein IGS52_21760 [Oscillatoriaceae cyanobacterium M33_DOE_052]|uniref:Uncharacterized protein n=1 Tax=Planktothricoides sp. SpSt-374 TaxID=2282167 RepID=A0A7C3ZML3_9CYAN|nr:hypothetical protein [Oscillatoriaceae cyanobacterium M33_DOE_052]
MDELRGALELATDDELYSMTEILFRPKFNPLDYLKAHDPLEIQSRHRTARLDAIEQRFRFLAADGLTVLLGKTENFSYRQALIGVCKYLKMPYSQALSTTELEAEVFLYLLGRAWKQLSEGDRDSLTLGIQRSLAQTNLSQKLPLGLQKDPLRLLCKGSSAIAVSSILKPLLLEAIARQFAVQFAKYEMAKQAVVQGGNVAAAQLKNYVSAYMARRGMSAAAGRYAATRGAFALLGTALWGWFLADLGWQAIATNYGRIIPTIFTLAQIRLTRTDFVPCS